MNPRPKRAATPAAIVLFGCCVLAFFITLLVQWPLAQTLRWLPELSQGSLHAADGSARGRWHDGDFRLLCRLPEGPALHCGDLHWQINPLWGPGPLGLRTLATQAEGGKLQWTRTLGDASTQGSIVLTQWRMPMAALAAWLPAVAQLQLGGPVWVDGTVQSGQSQLNLRWRSDIAGYATGEQKMRVVGTPDQIQIEFLPSNAGEVQAIALSGGARCSFSRVGASKVRCQGEIEIRSDRKNARLDNLLLAVAPMTAPGVFRLRVDAR